MRSEHRGTNLGEARLKVPRSVASLPDPRERRRHVEGCFQVKPLPSAQVYLLVEEASVAQRLEKMAAGVPACLRRSASAHKLNFTATVFITPNDFNYRTSGLARRACFQPAEPKRAVWLPNLGEVGPAHPSSVSSWCLFSFFFF